jgi:uncharacterized protein DUF4279
MIIADAALRIHGDLNLDEISQRLEMKPSYSHKKGEVGRIGRVFEFDMWSMKSPLENRMPLGKHLEWISETFEGKYEILQAIKLRAKIDVFCWVTSGEQDGFSLSPKALRIISALEIPMEVSLILGERE